MPSPEGKVARRADEVESDSPRKNRGIATPVCALVRNDTFYLSAFHFHKESS